MSCILFVDDNENALKCITRAFRRTECLIKTARSGTEALRLHEIMQFDVTVSDEKMPGMHGVELFSILRERRPECIRIMLTGSLELDTAVAAVNDGQVFRYLTKPVSALKLFSTIEDGLRCRGQRTSTKFRPANFWNSSYQSQDLLHKSLGHVRRTSTGAIIVPELSNEEMDTILLGVPNAI